MRQTEFTLSGSHFQQEATGWIQNVLALQDYHRKLTASELAKLLVMASVLGCSVFAAAQRSRRAPSGETVRKALLSCFGPKPEELEARIVAGLQSMLPKRFFRRPCRIAIDLHLRPYYGDPAEAKVCGGERKSGTKWFWAWATVAVVDRGERWTLAMTHVRPHEPLQDVVGRLLEALQKAKIPVKLLLLDRGFYSADVIALLQQRKLAFLMPAIRRGVLAGARGPTGTERFFQSHMRGYFQHTWTSRGGKRPGPTVTVGVACVPAPEKPRRGKGKPGRKRTRPLVYIFSGFRPPNLRWCREAYRKRFGIETTYRQLGQGLASTTSRNEQWRMLLAGIALLLRNLWVWLNQQPRCPEIILSLLLHQLLHYATEQLGLLNAFESVRRPRCASP